MGQKLDITVNVKECTGCRLCEMVCSLFHENVVNPEKARIFVADRYEESLFEPHICRLCDDPPCVNACPVEALSRSPETGIIQVDVDLCNGCETCVDACEYHAVQWKEEFQRLFVCDRCGGDPVCVQFCTSDVLVPIG